MARRLTVRAMQRMIDDLRKPRVIDPNGLTLEKIMKAREILRQATRGEMG